MKNERTSIGRERAIELSESHWWELCTEREIAEVQLFTAELCMPFSRFHEALEKSLRRPVFTHELGMDYDGICAEFLGERPAPTFRDIINLIPESKRIVIVADE